jgi:hypothetical protein
MKKLRFILILLVCVAVLLSPVLYELDKRQHEVGFSAFYYYYGAQVIHNGVTDDRNPKCPNSIGFRMDLIQGSCKIVFK